MIYIHNWTYHYVCCHVISALSCCFSARTASAFTAIIQSAVNYSLNWVIDKSILQKVIKNFNTVIKEYCKTSDSITNLNLNTFTQHYIRNITSLSSLNLKCIFNSDIIISFISELASEICFNDMNILTDLFLSNLTESDEELKKTHITLISEILFSFYTWYDISTVINLSLLSKHTSII